MAWVTILILAVMFVVLFKTTVPPDVVFLSAVTMMFITGAVDTTTALSGFSSASVVTVAALFVVIAGLYQTGVLKWVVAHVLGEPKSYVSALLRVIFPAALMSSVMTDSTVCALFIKVVKMWAKKIGIAASKLLIPMSYATLVGGTLTLLGTAPNLIVAGLYFDNTGKAMNIFTITPPALVCLLAYVVAIIVLRRLLPVRKSPDENFESTNEYTAELLVPTLNSDVGKTVGEAGLDSVKGGHLIEIVRFDKEVISPVSPDEFILGGDRLVFAGDLEQIQELKKTHLFVATDHHVFSYDDIDEQGRKLLTGTLKYNSEINGKRMSDTDFESRHGLVLVAVSRDGERIDDSPRNIVLASGDTLLMEYSSKMSESVMMEQLKDDFVMHESEAPIETSKRTYVSIAILVGMILLSSFKVLSVVQSAMLAAFASVLFRCCTPKQAQKSIHWDIVMIFACSVVFGKAIQENGIAEAIANGVASVCGGSVLLTMILVSIVALTVTEFVSNTAAAAIFFPIVYQLATNLGVDPKGFCLMLALCVSMSFATPIGSPVNTLVYGPGGYRFSDFLKIGIPMNIVMLFTIVTTIYLMYIV